MMYIFIYVYMHLIIKRPIYIYTTGHFLFLIIRQNKQRLVICVFAILRLQFKGLFPRRIERDQMNL